jgi:hypothetical protein
MEQHIGKSDLKSYRRKLRVIKDKLKKEQQDELTPEQIESFRVVDINTPKY